MTHFKANEYYRLSDGLTIVDNDGEVSITIKANSTNRTGNIASAILELLNRQFHLQQAYADDLKDNWNKGLFTKEEYDTRLDTITNMDDPFQ